MFRSIKTRLTVITCGILLLVFSLQMAANFLFAEPYYVYQKIKMMKTAYKQVIDLATTTDSNMEDILREVSSEINMVEFMLADENQDILYYGRDQFMPPVQYEPKRRMNPDMNFEKYPIDYYYEGPPNIIKSDMQDGDRVRLLGKFEREGETYYLALRLSVKSISRDMKSTNMFILYISSFALIAGGFVVYIISKQIAKPIEDINKVAVHVSNLDFSTRAPETKLKDEIGSLATNINTMSDKLSENIQSLKEANRKLEYDNEYMNRVDEQRKEFIANISHELKTPLAILSGYAELLSNDVPGIDKAFYYETLLDETHKMDLLIKDLLSFSHMENNLTNLSLEKLDLSPFTERIYRKYGVLFDNKGIQSELITLPEGSPECMVAADSLYLEEAINNYLSNAISYTKKGHQIVMKIEEREGEAILSVFNEGTNISEDNLEKIWCSFYRGDKSRTRTNQNNVGLGLSIVASIMKAHHGEYGVINRDSGVEFWLSLKTI